MSVLLYEIRDKVGLITLNRPEKMNAFDAEMLELWLEALQDARQNDEVQTVVLTGAGRAFCSGGDVGGMTALGELSALDHKRRLELIHRIPLELQRLDKPVIAAMNGPAVGAGLDMALMCDLRYAAAGAKFAEGYVKIGLIPGNGGTYFLPRLVGVARALELMWTGDPITAEEAERIGLVNRVLPKEELLPTVLELAGRLAHGPTIAIRTMKRSVYAGLSTDLPTHLDTISSAIGFIRETEDHREGARAFVEKRPPRFKGR